LRHPVALAALAAAVLAPAVVARGPARADEPAIRRALPPLEAAYPLPPLPEKSPRNANYTISARLDPVKHTIDGSLVLEWRNTSGVPLQTFPFHLYWNAFRNTLSTSARGGGSRGARLSTRPEDVFGYTHVRSIKLLGATETDLTPTLRYVAPDDGNADDRTVMEVRTNAPVGPGETARFRVEWSSLIPYGDVGRAGWVHDYNFIVQWFPKIGVYWKGAWNAHQFHPAAEFFADYGNYDVSLTLPKGFVVGATGRREGPAKDNGDGTETLRYVQEDVHDFAWTASRRFLERTVRFADAGYPPVDIRLLVQPEHAHLAERYLAATKVALRSYGAWSAPYPYPQITVVDPAWGSSSGGMEYPTLFTGGARVFSPPELQSPEGVTVHEAGHQFWYGLVGNNEFEEAWLDEGFNTYHTSKALAWNYGPAGWGRYYFAPRGGRGRRTGWPIVAPGVWEARGEGNLAGLRETGKVDVMARRGWEYRTRDSYGLNSYGKPALSMETLEGLVGDETMTRILRTYARRYRFAHPTSEDFIAVVNEVTGQDYRWFFDETWFSSNLCDYAILVENREPPKLEGYEDTAAGPPVRVPDDKSKKKKKSDAGPFAPEVTVLRLGEVRMPVEIRIEFADGRTVNEAWDGRDRWTRFKYPGPAKVVRAVVDPEGKIALDVEPGNNSWEDEKGLARRAATKWSARFLFWLQNLLELHALLG
jgi:Peptidase family M1 domain